MYDTVLVPTDGSEGTATVLSHAVDLADRHNATVHTVYVMDKRQLMGAPEEISQDLRTELRERGEAAVAQVREHAESADFDVITDITEGIPYRTILDYIETNDIDVIVMGTHGRTGRDRLETLGSVTERVVKHANIPVLVVTIEDS